MKKLFFILFVAFLSVTKADAQMYHPAFANYIGFGTMYFTDYWGNVTCMYQGYIYNGRPNTFGCALWADGSYYYGTFLLGVCHGKGVAGNFNGYISGTWKFGTFVSQKESDKSYSEVVQHVQKQYNSQNNSNQSLAISNRTPDNRYKEVELDPDSQMGKSLLGKVGGK